MKLTELMNELTEDMDGVISLSRSINGIHPTDRDELEIKLDGYSINRERMDKILLLINDIRDVSVTLTITYNYR